MCHGDQHWHARDRCFSCSHCSVSLVSKPFLPHNGAIYCSTLCLRKVTDSVDHPQETLASQQTIDMFFKLGTSTISSSTFSTNSSSFSFSKCPNLSTLSEWETKNGNSKLSSWVFFVRGKIPNPPYLPA